MRIHHKSTRFFGDPEDCRGNKTAVALVRGSKVDQQNTLVTQAATLRTYAEAKGIHILETCVDSGTSAQKVPFFERPEALRALEILSAGGGYHLLITKVDRAFRDYIDCGLTCRELWQDRGVSIHFVDEGLVSSNEKDQMFIQIRATIAEEENNRRRTRIRENFATLQAQNARCSRQEPYGWKIDSSRPRPTRRRDGDGGTVNSYYLIPNPEEQKVLDWIFALKRQNFSTHQIAQALNAKGIPPKGAARTIPGHGLVPSAGIWRASTIQSVLEHCRLADGSHWRVSAVGPRKLQYTYVPTCVSIVE